jgi:hypothetical protein
MILDDNGIENRSGKLEITIIRRIIVSGRRAVFILDKSMRRRSVREE